MTDSHSQPKGERLHDAANWNADEWHLFLCQHCDNRATSPNGMNTVALKIADALTDIRAKVDEVTAALRNVQKIIAEASMTGFNYKDGDWAERLFHSQQTTSRALALNSQHSDGEAGR